MVDISSLLLILIVSLLPFTSCKKDISDQEIIPSYKERIIEILRQKGGLNEFRDVYHYDDKKLIDHYIYRYTDKGLWKEWLRYAYEYPDENRITVTREGVSDSVWFYANKYEKTLIGDELEEVITYEYDEGSPGNWRPVKKAEWTYVDGRKNIRLTYTHPFASWEKNTLSLYEYTGSMWTGLYSQKYNDGKWDTTGCMVLVYQGGNLHEVYTYECQENANWVCMVEYKLQYDGGLLSEMVINKRSGDELKWERTLSIEYNENGNPVIYTFEYACCPAEEIHINYESGSGNYQQATQKVSDLFSWLWIPAPVKNTE